MAFQRKVWSLFFIYLVLSVDPIQASRIKSTKHAVGKMQETQALVREMQKALNEDQIEELTIHNASSLYIGETWATCAGRKADFERRSLKVKERYEAAQADGKITTVEAGWVVLKARKLAMTVSKAAKQGCEWVQNASAVDMTFLGQLMNQTGEVVPCRQQATAAMEKAAEKKGEPKLEDVTSAMSMLFSSDCKTQDSDASTSTEDLGQLRAAEEKEEIDAQHLVEKFKAEAQQGDKNGEKAISSLMERVATAAKSNIIFTIGGLLHVIIGMIIASVMCTIALVLWAIVLGLMYCLFRAVLTVLLDMLDQTHEFHDTFQACAQRWVNWLKAEESKEDAVKVGAAVCVLTTLIGNPIAGLNANGLWFNTNWGHGGYWWGGHYYR